MAIKGVSNFLHAPLINTAGVITYGPVVNTGGAIEAKPALTFNDGKLYSDNRLKHQDSTFKDGNMMLVVDYANKVILSPLLGRTTEPISFTPTGEGTTAVTSTKHISNAKDKPIPIGFGYIVSDYDPTTDKDVYTVRFFYKIEFKPYTQDAKTKEGTVAYTYTTLEGPIYELEDGNYLEEEDFDTLPVAVEYLNSLFV